MAKAEATTVSGTKRPSKAAASGDTPAPEKGAAKTTDGKAAPRPRKYDYGIQPENTVSAVAQETEPKLKAKEAEGYEMAQKGCTVEAFLAADPGNRGILRRLSRKGLVQITGKDGTTYPRDYVAPAPKPKAKAKADPQAGNEAA